MTERIKTIRMTVPLSDSDQQNLDKFMDVFEILQMSTAIRKCIGIGSTLAKAQEEGCRVTIRRPDGSEDRILLI